VYLKSLQSRPRVKVLWLPRAGNPAAARNAALSAATGEYVAFLDSDDLWLPQKLEVQLGALRLSPACQWSYTGFKRIGADGSELHVERTRRWVSRSGAIFRYLVTLELGVTMPTVMATRRLLDAAGRFREDQLLHEDYDMWMRLALLSEVVVVRRELACVRYHRQHYSSGGIRSAAAWGQVLGRMRDIVSDPQLCAIVKAQKARNTVRLAHLYAAEGHAAAVLRTLARGWSDSWWRGTWWWGSARALLRLLLPYRWIEAWRSLTARFAGPRAGPPPIR
jgi:glycosyltransferase involved in cell wall biosynthesis